MEYFVALKSLGTLHKEGVTLSAFAEHQLCDLHDRLALTRLHKLKVEKIDGRFYYQGKDLTLLPTKWIESIESWNPLLERMEPIDRQKLNVYTLHEQKLNVYTLHEQKLQKLKQLVLSNNLPILDPITKSAEGYAFAVPKSRARKRMYKYE